MSIKRREPSQAHAIPTPHPPQMPSCTALRLASPLCSTHLLVPILSERPLPNDRWTKMGCCTAKADKDEGLFFPEGCFHPQKNKYGCIREVLRVVVIKWPLVS